MRNLVINISDISSEHHPSDEVQLWSPEVRGSKTHRQRVISTAVKRVPLTRGKATIEVEEGPLMVMIRCRGTADMSPKKVFVPQGDGDITLRTLLDEHYEYPAEVVGAAQEAARRAERAASQIQDVSREAREAREKAEEVRQKAATVAQQAQQVATHANQSREFAETASGHANTASSSAQTATTAAETVTQQARTVSEQARTVETKAAEASRSAQDAKRYADSAKTGIEPNSVTSGMLNPALRQSIEGKRDKSSPITHADLGAKTQKPSSTTGANAVVLTGDDGLLHVEMHGNAPTQVVDKQYVDRQASLALKRAESTRTSGTNADANKVVMTDSSGRILSTTAPEESSHVANKSYVDTKVSQVASGLATTTTTGSASNRGKIVSTHVDGFIHQTGAPTAGTHLVTKAFLDSQSVATVRNHAADRRKIVTLDAEGKLTISAAPVALTDPVNLQALKTELSSVLKSADATESPTGGKIVRRNSAGATLVRTVSSPLDDEAVGWGKIKTELGLKVSNSDARLSDARRPIAHSHVNVSDFNSVSVVNANGSSGAKNKLTKTSSTGYLEAGTPTLGAHVANKSYVDSKVQEVSTSAGSDIGSNAYANKIVKTGSDGKLFSYAQPPTNSRELIPKWYVDELFQEGDLTALDGKFHYSYE